RRAESGLTIGAIELPEVLGLTTLGVAVAILLCLYRLPNGIAGRSEIDASLPLLRRLVPPARGRPEPEEEAASVARRSREPLLEVASISKSFGGVDAVSQVSLTVRPGQILGILGANGAGKSTLLALIGGSLPVDSGQIVLTGRDVTRAPSHTRARMGLARTFQSIRLFSYLSVRENIRAASVAAGERGREADAHADRLMDLLDLTERADSFAAELEYGAQRRLEIARALAMRPRIVLLDEPAAGMNTAETEALGETLLDIRARLGLAIVLVEHDVAFVTRLSDTIMVLDKGEQIAAGSPDAVLNDPRVIDAYIGRSTADQSAEWTERTAARTVPAQTL
ncbi:MAG: ABC transporter ATP-binding protein, partial [Pseudomonadota bacterium]